MDLIDKEDVMFFQIGQNGRQIPPLLNGRPRGGAEIHIQLIGDDVGKRGFSQSRGAEKQDMIEGFAPLFSRFHRDLDAVLDLCWPMKSRRNRGLRLFSKVTSSSRWEEFMMRSSVSILSANFLSAYFRAFLSDSLKRPQRNLYPHPAGPWRLPYRQYV